MAYAALGQFEESLGHFEEALSYYSRILELDDKDKGILVRRGAALHALQSLCGACMMCSRYLSASHE